ncbi:hypothetical protein [Yersinia phage fHe-Yen9-04]|uniref:Uncharacterized protein n=2 Tax=Eneladusvirus Yen904 TaxID=2560849 RepID=A0A2C9CXX7_9CAUD|nr:hypothetical protein FDJ41_gp483 [Yersinia phage fHe-Yen9-04]SOK58697.1 hypothetical protein [Yersinia phage fHe-Yen9-04]SOK59231.1 hypothetical protein [Yersinia phage fHe-Yen9-03]VUE36466.1 hypothetical protein [Yersinia phage fHe-Yen9-04]
MTLEEIQKKLDNSFQNGYYIRRPHFNAVDNNFGNVNAKIECYISRTGNVYDIRYENNKITSVVSTVFTLIEKQTDDWEIVI